MPIRYNKMKETRIHIMAKGGGLLTLYVFLHIICYKWILWGDEKFYVNFGFWKDHTCEWCENISLLIFIIARNGYPITICEIDDDGYFDRCEGYNKQSKNTMATMSKFVNMWRMGSYLEKNIRNAWSPSTSSS